MKIVAFIFIGVLFSFHEEVQSFSCPGIDFRGTTACEAPKCCESGQLTSDACNLGCDTCASAEESECGAGFEAYQPYCARDLSCFTRCPCKTESSGPGSAKDCVFPFKYRGKTYQKCTTADSTSNKAWCAYDIEPGTEVPDDNQHWGDCEMGCPGTDLEEDCNLINERGVCVPKSYESSRIVRTYKSANITHGFNPGATDTKPITKCSDLSKYEQDHTELGICYCLPPRNETEKLRGEGCTKENDDSWDPDFVPVPGAGPPTKLTGWCYLAGLKDPRFTDPSVDCQQDIEWSESAQKFWSQAACDDVPLGGL